MIPKKIHYCWFGRKPLPKSAKKCIRSWKKYFPDYEIVEWNEDNYDVNKIRYTQQAYQEKKYAFVSDYARFDILYHEGGVYFDTDVEVIWSFNDILERGAFMGCEIDGVDSEESHLIHSSNRGDICVNPGLGIAAPPGMRLYKEFLDLYADMDFIQPDGSYNTVAVVKNTTQLLLQHGMKNRMGIQSVDGITIYPKAYFNPLNSLTGILEKSENTHSIHWYSMSWLSPYNRLKSRLARLFHRIFGINCFECLKK